MKLLGLKFDEPDANGAVLPSVVTVTMTIVEAALIARIIGRLTNPQSEVIVPVQHGAHHGIYDCLSGAVFNRYWDGGCDEFIRSL